jgi:hypothetical protein
VWEWRCGGLQRRNGVVLGHNVGPLRRYAMVLGRYRVVLGRYTMVLGRNAGAFRRRGVLFRRYGGVLGLRGVG